MCTSKKYKFLTSIDKLLIIMGLSPNQANPEPTYYHIKLIYRMLLRPYIVCELFFFSQIFGRERERLGPELERSK